MKKILLLSVCFVFLLQISAFAETKIGVFQSQKVLAECDYGKAVAARLKSKYEPLAKEIQKEGDVVKKLEEELSQQNLALKLEAKQDKQREYRRKMRDLQDSYAAFQQKQQVDQQKLLSPIKQKIGVTVAEYAKANGYTIVFEANVAGVAYLAEGIDISDAVIAELNKKKKAGK
jgi:outer membrane protein